MITGKIPLIVIKKDDVQPVEYMIPCKSEIPGHVFEDRFEVIDTVDKVLEVAAERARLRKSVKHLRISTERIRSRVASAVKLINECSDEAMKIGNSEYRHIANSKLPPIYGILNEALDEIQIGLYGTNKD